MSVLPLAEEFNPPISCAIFTKEKRKKKRTHCSAPITKTSLTIHFFSYVPCTLGHKHGGSSWVEGSDFSLFLQFPFHLSFYSSTFSPSTTSLSLRIVHCHYSPPSISFTLHALEIPKTSYTLLIEQHPSFLLPHCTKYYYT